MAAKLLCYELNEVSWRVIDYYIGEKPDSHLASLLAKSAQLTTHCNDQGELQPWSTWSTLHRGVSNETHKINYLNQDLTESAAWPPVWNLLNQADVTTGIFGSLQSYPPVEDQRMKFHIPDTFAAGDETKPMRAAPFQAFNLQQTGANKATASDINTRDLPDILGLLKAGIKPQTLLKVISHLVRERINPLHKSRRSILQPMLAFDVFLRCLQDDQPEFVTFFSNHVAGIMHRYWKYSFPDDFDVPVPEDKITRFHRESLIKAMDLFDEQLGMLMKFGDKNDYRIIVTSSMGQEAIDRGEYIDELQLNEIDNLTQALGCDYPVGMNLAMQPDIAFTFESKNDLQDFSNKISRVKDADGASLLVQRYEAVGTTLNIASTSTKTLVNDRTVYYEGKKYPLDKFGLDLINRDQGTAYHQPEGILIWEGNSIDGNVRATVDSRRFAPSLLTYFGVEPREYMARPMEV